MTGIIGSGFGLYGYMPAVLMNDAQVMLQEKAKERFLKRNELLRYEQQILWAQDLDSLLSSVDALVISLPPKEQLSILEKLLQHENIKHLILEKPVAATPLQSLKVLQLLFDKGINFRVNYTFLEANWFKQLKASFAESRQADVSIKWHFNAHHFRNNIDTWKKKHEEGGAAIRFYAIHFIALATELGFNKVVASTANDETVASWLCTLVDDNGNTLTIDISTNSKLETFHTGIVAQGKDVFTYITRDPFDEVEMDSTGLDKRIKGLNLLYGNLKSANINESTFNDYQAINFLWSSAEEQLTNGYIQNL
jgi:predicted dehydrogenase